MSSSRQAVYATNLQQNCGYPLRVPEPSSPLVEPYEKEGLQIGDVGYVNDDGAFIRRFNIRFRPDPEETHEHARPPYDLIELNQSTKIPHAFPEDYPFTTGVKRKLDAKGSSGYEFTASSSAGAILILPLGAALIELKDQQKLKEFYKTAADNALSWCKFVNLDSLYLITGVYNARSWTLGSFDGGQAGGQIRVEQREKSSSETGAYKWDNEFPMDWRSCSKNNDLENQTVLLKGFKITVRLAGTLTVVERVAGWRNPYYASLAAIISALLAMLFAMFSAQPPRIAIVRHPQLTQPLHFTDLINRYLLDKDPNADVAITHDDEWIKMLEKRSFTELLQEDTLRDFLEKEYVCHSDRGTVCLQSRISDSDSAQHKTESESLQPMTESKGAQVVITYIRAEDVTVGLGRIPVGFHVRVEFDGGTPRRTTNKSAPVYDRVIQWDDLIHLPSDLSTKVRLVVCASFEFTPTLGKGEPLRTLEMSVGDLLSHTGAFTFSDKEGEPVLPCSSLLVTVQQWQTSGPDQVCGSLDPTELFGLAEVIEETDIGHDALHRYQKEGDKKDLDSSVLHFRNALDRCPDEQLLYRAATLANLARVEFFTYQYYGTRRAYEGAISCYQEALELRHGGHPDRPMTLLQLAQARLYRYEIAGDETSTENELRKLVDELKDACLEDTHECLATVPIHQTYERLRLRDSDDLEKLNKLISELDKAAHMAPDGYFDRPTRYNNLGLALQRRFQLRGDNNDLEGAITWLEKALEVIPNNHPEKPNCLSNLSNALLIRFRQQLAVPLARQS